jgi:methylenetetrahydrofolate reductase (NADPH)
MLHTEIDGTIDDTVARELARLASEASIEINVADEKYLDESRFYLPLGTRIYVSHLPRQKWEATVRTCEAVRQAGFKPVPHVPVRLLESQAAFAELLAALQSVSGALEILLISGDYAQPSGPYHSVSEALSTGLLERHGFTGVSIAGHPEGHPRVALDCIREAERQKVHLAAEHGLEVRFITQFLFESAPYFQWVNDHREMAFAARYVCGLAGPAKITTLMRYALRCGVGSSIRALGSHHSALKNILGDHGPDGMLGRLVEGRATGACVLDGVHMFCFGGFLRTAQWLSRIARHEVNVNEDAGDDA